MGTVINLNKVRKRKAREHAEAVAAANRVRFGRTPAERERDEVARENSQRKLEGHRRDPQEEPGDS